MTEKQELGVLTGGMLEGSKIRIGVRVFGPVVNCSQSLEMEMEGFRKERDASEMDFVKVTAE